MIRLCRICMAPDVTNSFSKLFDNNARLAADIFNLFSVIITSTADETALICRKCEKHVMQAVDLKNTLMLSEEYFKSRLSSHRCIWNELLAELEKVPQETCDLNSIDLGDFMIEADDALGSSLQELEEFEKLTQTQKRPKTVSKGKKKKTHSSFIASKSKQKDEVFIKKADCILSQTLKCIDNLKKVNELHDCTAISNLKPEKKPQSQFRLPNNNGVREKAFFDTSNNHHSLDESLDTDLEFLDLLTPEMILEMTNAISKVLPKQAKTVARAKRSLGGLRRSNISSSSNNPGTYNTNDKPTYQLISKLRKLSPASGKRRVSFSIPENSEQISTQKTDHKIIQLANTFSRTSRAIRKRRLTIF